MKSAMKGIGVCGILAAAAWLSACGDSGGSSGADAGGGTTYHVTLTKEAEVPVCTSAGSGATGTADVTVSADNTSIAVNVSYSGLSGAATSAHIHAGAAGQMGGVVLSFTNVGTSPFSKTFTATDYVATAGAPVTFAEFVTSLKNKGAYLNVHTSACGGGEIRGQIQ